MFVTVAQQWCKNTEESCKPTAAAAAVHVRGVRFVELRTALRIAKSEEESEERKDLQLIGCTPTERVAFAASAAPEPSGRD